MTSTAIVCRLTITLVALGWNNLAFSGEIHDAARDGDAEKVKLLLAANPALALSTDASGATPLIWAVTRGHKEITILLLAGNADINAKINTGLTSLHFAVDRGYKDLVELLLAHNADVEAMDKNGLTPLHVAANQDRAE